jgi:hypothetical protein
MIKYGLPVLTYRYICLDLCELTHEKATIYTRVITPLEQQASLGGRLMDDKQVLFKYCSS